MLQVKKNQYSLKTLLSLNTSYNLEHHLTQDDVDKVNEMVRNIERARSNRMPKIGDRLIYVSRHGDYTNNALIEKRDKEKLALCVNPFIPFVHFDSGTISLNVSGGPFTSMRPEEAKYIGWTKGAFKVWGHCGACGNGTVQFYAQVGLWEYREANPLYGDFTTKTWRRLYLYKTSDPLADYLYRGEGVYLKTEKALEDFLRDSEGTIFPGNWSNQFVVWCFHEIEKGISLKQWEAMDAPVILRKIYQKLQEVKVYKDMEAHKIIYFYVIPQN